MPKLEACIFISFYFQSANRLTPEEKTRPLVEQVP
jgi:hypothetical protein